jgi:gas vesicle protein
LKNILASLKKQATSTQAQSTENASHGTVLERSKGSGSKLLVALKFFFSRTDKSKANAVVVNAVPQVTIKPITTPPTKKVSFAPDAVTKAVPQATTSSINSEVEKLGRPEPDLRSRVRQVYRQLPNQTEVKVSHFDTAVHKIIDGAKLYDGELTKTLKELGDIKTSVEQNKEMNDASKNQLLKDIDLLIKLAANGKEKIGTGHSPQNQMVQSFKTDFDSNFKSMIAKIPGMNNEKSTDVKIIRAAIIRTANTELSLQINDDSNDLKKENFKKAFEATLKIQFNNNISSDLLNQITKAVSDSFDFADAEKLRKMQAGKFQ